MVVVAEVAGHIANLAYNLRRLNELEMGSIEHTAVAVVRNMTFEVADAVEDNILEFGAQSVHSHCSRHNSLAVAQIDSNDVDFAAENEFHG